MRNTIISNNSNLLTHSLGLFVWFLTIWADFFLCIFSYNYLMSLLLPLLSLLLHLLFFFFSKSLSFYLLSDLIICNCMVSNVLTDYIALHMKYILIPISFLPPPPQISLPHTYISVVFFIPYIFRPIYFPSLLYFTSLYFTSLLLRIIYASIQTLSLRPSQSS